MSDLFDAFLWTVFVACAVYGGYNLFLKIKAWWIARKSK